MSNVRRFHRVGPNSNVGSVTPLSARFRTPRDRSPPRSAPEKLRQSSGNISSRIRSTSDSEVESCDIDSNASSSKLVRLYGYPQSEASLAADGLLEEFPIDEVQFSLLTILSLSFHAFTSFFHYFYRHNLSLLPSPSQKKKTTSQKGE